MGATGGKNTPRHRRDAARLVINTSRTISAVTDEIGTRERPLGGREANDLTAPPMAPHQLSTLFSGFRDTRHGSETLIHHNDSRSQEFWDLGPASVRPMCDPATTARPVQRIVPSLWFDHCAPEAVDLYVHAFRQALGQESGDLDDPTATGVVEVSHYPTEGLADFQADMAGEALEIRFRLAGLEMSAINAGPELMMNPAISFMVFVDPRVPGAVERLDGLWARLEEGGGVLMPLGTYPFSERFGWVSDRYGATWQLVLGTPGVAATRSEIGRPAPTAGRDGALTTADNAADDPPSSPLVIVPTLMFPHGQHQAAEAAGFYTDLFGGVFGDSGIGQMSFYPPDAGQGEHAVMQGFVRLAGQSFAVMDSGVPHAFTFDLGVSLIVVCRDQAQVDQVWDTLSAVPEAEMCGWLRDRFGISWQVSPEKMTTLMHRPGAWEVMSSMKKPVLADFEAL